MTPPLHDTSTATLPDDATSVESPRPRPVAADAMADTATGMSPAPTDAMRTQFASRDDLLAHVTMFSLSQGYAVVIHKSNVPRGQLWLRCDLGGASHAPSAETDASAPNGTKKRKRKPSQRMQNCPFRLYGRRLADGTWTLKIQNNLHTHSLASHAHELVAHPKARRLSNVQKRLVLEMTDVGIRPAVIVERLKAQFPDKPIAVQDIYNARNHIRMERLAGRVPFPEVNDGEHKATSDGGGVETGTRPRRVQQELQSLWAAMVETLPHWSLDKQTEFIRNVYGLLDGTTSSDEVSDPPSDALLTESDVNDAVSAQHVENDGDITNDIANDEDTV